MGFEDGQSEFVTEPKSSGKKWLVGGCGCLLLIVALCGGGGYFVYAKFLQPAINHTFENMSIAQNSEKVKEVMGEPVNVGQPSTQQDGNRMTMRFPVSGPNGDGVVVVESTINESNFTFTRDAMYLEFDGEQINIDPDAETSLDLEGLEGLDDL